MRSVLARARLVATDGSAVATELLVHEAPSVRLEITDACGVCDAIVDVDDWTAAVDLSEIDAAVLASPSDALSVRGRGERLAEVGCQVLGRYQRFIDRRNAASATRAFDVVLRAHCGAHDGDDTGWERSRDRWQWLLRVNPRASAAAQIAALFRDASGSAIETAVAVAGLPLAVATRARGMARDGDPDVEDAEGLSFLSLDSARATRREVTIVAAALRPEARAKLPLVHLTPEVRHWLFDSVAA